MLAFHAREGAQSISERKYPAAIVPTNGNCGSGTCFISIAIASIFVEEEFGIFPCIDTEIERLCRLRCRLHDRAHGNDAALTHEYRNPIQWCIGDDRLASPVCFPCPKIN